MQFVLKVDRMGGKTEIRGLAVGADRITRLEILAKDYISQSALPLRITLDSETGAEVENSRTNPDDLPAKLAKVFISPERISDLAILLRLNVIQKLIPGLQKEGYEESADDRAVREDADRAGREGPSRQPQPQPQDPGLPQPARPYPFNDPLAAPPRRPVPAGEFAPPNFEDEFEILRPPRGVGPQMPGGGGRSPFNIGHDDLHPPGLGPRDPFAVFPGGGTPSWGGMGGGMHPTFDDPLFRGPDTGGNGGGYDLQVPPGARWDPVGPGLRGPRFGGGGPGGGGFGGFGSGGNHFGGDII